MNLEEIKNNIITGWIVIVMSAVLYSYFFEIIYSILIILIVGVVSYIIGLLVRGIL